MPLGTAVTIRQSGFCFGFIPRGGGGGELGILFDARGLISRVSAKIFGGGNVFLVCFLCVFFVLFWGCFLFCFIFRALARIFCFFFGGGMSKTGNFRSVIRSCPAAQGGPQTHVSGAGRRAVDFRGFTCPR